MLYLLPHIIDNSASRFPDKEAFRFDGTSLTYSEFVRRANAVAKILVEQGVRRGDRVGILLFKGLASAVSIYGVMKAGAAYVPLDPFSPAARLESALSHLGIRHLVTDETVLQHQGRLESAVRSVDGLVGVQSPLRSGQAVASWDDVAALESDRSPQIHATEDDLAYIMFTSGSTGVPKGIMHTHRSGLSYARTSRDLYGVEPSDRLSNHSPLHFDMSTFDYFTGPLAAGTTVIISEAHTRFPVSLSSLVQDERLTIWYSVPFALTQLLLRGELEQRDLSSLRWVLFGGEPFPPKYLAELMSVLPKARFSNVYGPAEVNQCTFYNVPAGFSSEPLESVPLGHIWPNAEGLIVDERDREIETGDIGELLIRTTTMMQGYWQDPARNAEAFLNRASDGGVVHRFYRTGDLVKQTDDGVMLFLGRKDRQVKVRGYRIELDEIEAALLRNSKVEEAAAYTVVDKEGMQSVEASVIPSGDAKVMERELIRFLAESIPPYAVPTRVSIMKSFPRTGSGKIDRGKLGQRAATV
jgi:amino acid adenylation domain-containing protein